VSVPVRGTLHANKEGKFTEQHAAAIGKRLIALEKAWAGASPSYVSPSAPSFGGGAPGTPGAPGAPGAPGTTDHGALTGLLDDDHPQYVPHGQEAEPNPHLHGAAEIVGLEARFEERIEALSPVPHVHRAEDVRGIETPVDYQPAPHVHSMNDIADFDPAQIMLFVEVFGG